MGLLDLPPELLERVVQILAKKTSLAQLWEVRKTCSKYHRPPRNVAQVSSSHIDRLYRRLISIIATLRDFIEFEALSKSSLQAYKVKGNEHILRNKRHLG
jgi:hypothetical protein